MKSIRILLDKKTNSTEQSFFNFMMFKENRVRISVKTSTNVLRVELFTTNENEVEPGVAF